MCKGVTRVWRVRLEGCGIACVVGIGGNLFTVDLPTQRYLSIQFHRTYFNKISLNFYWSGGCGGFGGRRRSGIARAGTLVADDESCKVLAVGNLEDQRD